MKRYYDNMEDNVAFERCIDVMTKMILRYGPQVLKQLEQESAEGTEDKNPSEEKVSWIYAHYTLRLLKGGDIIHTQCVFGTKEGGY